ncbi:glutamic acid-rich protein [Lucilia cuprina]|uniref:glutamic acid-rich protein n=1 Tax=Lucilia cuprina TaxID=7375 RepID=UPI001F06C328|nr:glutamic acid-rich protein [Lucilia cuprina]
MGKRVIESHDNNNHHHHHQQHVTPVTTGQRNIRKRKCNSNLTNSKNLRMNTAASHTNNSYWHENDDEDSSSNDGPPVGLATTPRNTSSKQANNSSILLNNSLNVSLMQNDNNSTVTESPKPVYTLRPSVVNGTVLYDLAQKPWRLGRPIGKGNFGEIFLASDNISIPVTNENAKFVVKIEPHSNGPLFVEIHCLMNTAKKNCTIKNEENTTSEKHEETAAACNNLPKGEPSGIPDYIASGSHYFGNARYRFLVLPRFDRDLHSLIKKCRVHQKSVLTLAIHIINVLENLHDKGYCHNDVKAQNLMISKCKYLQQKQKTTTTTTSLSNYSNEGSEVNAASGKQQQQQRLKSSKYDDHYEEKQQTTDSGNSSEQEANDDDEDFVVKRKVYNSKDIDRDYEEDDDDDEEEDESSAEDNDDEDEDFDDGATTNSMNSNSRDTYETPVNKNKRVNTKKTSSRNIVQYSGSNPVRSCRREKPNSIYDEMVKSHYLRPTKRISYSEFFNEDGVSVKSHGHGGNSNSSSDMHSNSSDDESEEFVPLPIRRSIKSTAKKTYTTNLASRRLTRRQEKLLGLNNKRVAEMHCSAATDAANDDDSNKHKVKTEKHQATSQQEPEWIEIDEERIFLIDYGLASKFIDNGVHRPFVMDQRRAHDGTLEFTSRDAHMGAHSRRSDMECLGYNLLFWSQGYLPWKEAATNQQQEKVHRAKEFLMTDVRELLRQIYGKQVPNYLGEYLHLVGQLAYHERPDYERYRRLFEREYQQLGYSLSEMHLQMHEIQRTCVRVKEEIENKNDFFETNKNNGACNMVLNIMQNLSVGGTPFHERTLSNRVSPKNLRSKSDKKDTKKKKFSWAEILSQDPDQIARERAEKEFDREEELSEVQQPLVRRYQGKPTAHIIAVLAILGRSVKEYEEETNKLEKEYKEKQHKQENKMEVDECDNVKAFKEAEEEMEEDNHNDDDDQRDEEDCQEQQAVEEDDAETDATETSEHFTRRKTTASSTTQKQRTITKRNTKTSSSKTTASRRLILKTPQVTTTPSNTDTNGNTLSATPVCARTRGKRAATTVKKYKSPSLTANKTKAKTTKKRGSAIKSMGRKTSSSTTSGTSAASAAGEIDQHQQDMSNTTNNNNNNNKRERRTRRCLMKTDLATSESLQEDDSNSNFSPDVWKINTEAMYTRNCRK